MSVMMTDESLMSFCAQVIMEDGGERRKQNCVLPMVGIFH